VRPVTPVFQRHLREDTRTFANNLPGTRPLDLVDWLLVDEAHADQMALRDRLLRTRRQEVVAERPAAREPSLELLDMVLAHLAGRDDFIVGDDVTRPDGVRVPVERRDPLGTLGRLAQEDFCILLKQSTEHVLEGAVLCFPSRWLLSEKIGRPLTAIHRPVAPYDDDLARRVQRLFDGVRAGRPLWRANLLRHHVPDLFQPLAENAKVRQEPAQASYLRSERQCILRLPHTRAVVFSIHTTILGADAKAAPEGAA
jgi:hypothetical protein